MQSLAVGAWTADQVADKLHGAAHLGFRYELLDADNNVLRDITDFVRGGSIENNALAEISRTAKFTILDTVEINWLSDRIRPWVRLNMENGWAEWPQGVFLLSTPTRRIGETNVVERDVDAYDQTVILREDLVEDRYTIAAGANYVEAVRTLLTAAGIDLLNLTASSHVLPVAQDWEPGTSRYAIIADLLDAINYRALYFDSRGYAVAQPYVSPDGAAAEYEYRVDSRSVMFPEASETLDLFEVANKWVLVVSEPDMAPIVASYTNTDPASPTSTVSRGRTIVDFRTEESAADWNALQAKAERLAFAASQVYGVVEFTTALMPHHEHGDVLMVEYPDLGVSDKYVEHTWSMELSVGARMSHKVRKVVSV